MGASESARLRYFIYTYGDASPGVWSASVVDGGQNFEIWECFDPLSDTGLRNLARIYRGLLTSSPDQFRDPSGTEQQNWIDSQAEHIVFRGQSRIALANERLEAALAASPSFATTRFHRPSATESTEMAKGYALDLSTVRPLCSPRWVGGAAWLCHERPHGTSTIDLER